MTKRVVVIGSTGSGKSSLCNVLSGQDYRGHSRWGFPVSDGFDACTFQTTSRTVQWLGTGDNVILVDTPGLDDPQGKDSQHVAEMVEKLKEIRTVNVFLVVMNAQRPRMDGGLKSMLKIFERMFGRGFRSHVVFAFSRWSYDRRSQRQRDRDDISEASLAEEMNEGVQMELNWTNTIPCVFIDSCWSKTDYEENERFQEETSKLRSFMMEFRDYSCGGFQKVLTDSENLKMLVDRCKEETRKAQENQWATMFEKTQAEARERMKEREAAEARQRELQTKLEFEKRQERINEELREKNKMLQLARQDEEAAIRRAEREARERELQTRLEFEKRQERINEEQREIDKMLQLARQQDEEAAIRREREAQKRRDLQTENLQLTSNDNCNSSDYMQRDVTGAVGGMSFSSLSVRSGTITSNGSQIGGFQYTRIQSVMVVSGEERQRSIGEERGKLAIREEFHNLPSLMFMSQLLTLDSDEDSEQSETEEQEP